MADANVDRAGRTRGRRGALAARAFSLVELLTVLFIIALVIAILIPAVRGARDASRRAASMAMMSNVTQAAKQFELDNRRQPGYFSAAAMGSAENVNRGFTAMKNVMLDLAGGITQGAEDQPRGIYADVGPTAAETVTVDVGQIGAPSGKGAAGTKSYFAPDRQYLAVQNVAGQLVAPQMTAGNLNIPELVDAFGNPVLAWVADERATSATVGTGLGTANDGFAAIASGTTPQSIARFYWNSNAAILSATSVGKRARSQAFQASNAAAGYSMLGVGRPAPAIVRSLTGILGNSAYPKPDEPLMPSEALGKLVLHSAGSDGWYLGNQDRGGKNANAVAEKAVLFKANFDPKPEFDDVFVSGGN